MDSKPYSDYYLNQARNGIADFSKNRKGSAVFITPNKPFDFSIQEKYTRDHITKTTTSKNHYITNGTETDDESDDSDIEASSGEQSYDAKIVETSSCEEAESDDETSDGCAENSVDSDTSIDSNQESSSEGDSNDECVEYSDGTSIDSTDEISSDEESEEQLGNQRVKIMRTTGRRSGNNKIETVKGNQKLKLGTSKTTSSKPGVKPSYPNKKRSKFDKLF